MARPKKKVTAPTDANATRADLEKLNGLLVRAVLAKYQLNITSRSRVKLLGHVSNALNEAARVTLPKGIFKRGDVYPSDGGCSKSRT